MISSSQCAYTLVYAILQALDWEEFEQTLYWRLRSAADSPHAGGWMYSLRCDAGIRSSRQLEEATRTRVDFMWLLERRTIRSFDAGPFPQAFHQRTQGAQPPGGHLDFQAEFEALEALETLIIDGARVRANSNRHGARTAPALEKIIAACVRALDERLASLAREDGEKEAGAQTAVLKTKLRGWKGNSLIPQGALPKLKDVTPKRKRMVKGP